ncbi:hypothetical protein NQ317_015131 [Molorchus minor]|uniref:Spaetzle domain-containing protein n=1 Tax=Molorchus minor TaxID=1323400 RepID=A0ABQ9K5H2_9CUCU|nr:hypothetical protein NQ317_015131 [Molorchus minor]
MVLNFQQHSIYFTRCHADPIDRSTRRPIDPYYGDPFQHGAAYPNRALQSPERRDVGNSNFRQNGPYNKDPYVDTVRHTHTSTRVDLSDIDHFLHGPSPTTARNHVKQGGGNNVNVSTVPDLITRSSNNKRKSEATQPPLCIRYNPYHVPCRIFSLTQPIQSPVSAFPADDGRMVFPTDSSDYQDQFRRHANTSYHSKSCYDGLCDDVDNYPAEKIKRIIAGSKELKRYFSTQFTDVVPTTVPPNVVNRFGGDASVESLCPTMSQTRFPRTAVNMNNQEQLLINIENYKQGIIYEKCSEQVGNKPCKFSENFPQDYETICEQKYTVRKLMVVGKESEGPIFDDFKIPSCCVCSVKKITKT